MTGRSLTHEQSSVLLGALAVDAVEPDEFVALEEHLAQCAPCRNEVRCHHETLTELVGQTPPPSSLRDRVLASGPVRLPADVEMPPIDPPTLLSAARGRRTSPTLTTVALSAAATILLVIAVGAAVLRSANHPPSLDEVAGRAKNDESNRSVALVGSSGGAVASVVVARDGTGFLFSNGLPSLPAGRTYQLWAMGGSDGKTPVSLGVLGRDPDVSTFSADARITGFALSEEGDGGAVTPSTALAAGTLSA